jgi:peptidoglycan/xylan/chitin deacetylase (PgdA/CDA1 family)
MRAFTLIALQLALASIALPTALADSSAPLRAPPEAPKKLIALSFDDVPRGPGAFYTPEHRTKVLINALRRSGVTQAAFFVNPGRIGTSTDNVDRVNAYVMAGHVIADHSFSHRDLSHVSADVFLADVDKAEDWLKPRPGYRPWFRFPGLNQGGRDHVKRQTVLDGLARRGLLVAAVTVDGSDWNMERLTIDAKKAGKPMDDAALGQLYVETMVQAADFSDAVMRRAIGRSPAHMLLLHETDLAARYVGQLVAALRRDGWEIVPADAAYADPVYHMPLNVPGSNGTLTEALGWEKGVKGPLDYDRTDPKVADKVFAERILQPALAGSPTSSPAG